MSESRPSFSLVNRLYDLAEDGDRAALACLRRGAGKRPGSEVAMYPYVIPFVPEQDAGPQRAWPYFVVAALFSLHPSKCEGRDFGAAFRQLGDSPSRDARFRALLNAHPDELPHHLRHAVSQMAAGGISIDWQRLLADLRSWGDPRQWVQQRWARSFWAPAGEEF